MEHTDSNLRDIAQQLLKSLPPKEMVDGDVWKQAINLLQPLAFGETTMGSAALGEAMVHIKSTLSQKALVANGVGAGLRGQKPRLINFDRKSHAVHVNRNYKAEEPQWAVRVEKNAEKCQQTSEASALFQTAFNAARDQGLFTDGHNASQPLSVDAQLDAFMHCMLAENRAGASRPTSQPARSR